MRKNHQSTTRHLDKYFLVLPAFLFSMLVIHPVPGIANDYLHAASADTTISPKALKTFEGYYKFQLQNGSDSYIHIAATEKGLVLQQIWDRKEIAFAPKSALEFVSEDGNFPLKFTKGSNGAITQVLAFDRDLWIKTNDYKPPVIKEVRLDPGKLKALEGKYTFQFEKGEDAFIQIRATEKGLILKQMWDGKEFPFVAESDLDFYCKEAQFPLKFTRDKSGNAIQVLAFNRDLWNKVKE
ncbi:MAG TPA: hypothetical protein VK543_00910 [Puia sp.]|nr:hypothetical protein [Puia sp.]